MTAGGAKHGRKLSQGVQCRGRPAWILSFEGRVGNVALLQDFLLCGRNPMGGAPGYVAWICRLRTGLGM